MTPPAPSRSFDLHGCGVLVEGPAANGWFALEYGAFEVETLGRAPDILVQPGPVGRDALRPKGSRLGLEIRRDDARTVVTYEPRLDPTHVLPWVETLLRWPDKALAHASGVTRDGRASVFFAGQKTGKTSTVLQLARKGYDFLGDDFVIVGAGKAFPYPRTIHLYDYNLADDAGLARRVLGRALPWPAIMRARAKARRAVLPRLPTRAARYAADVALSRMVAAVPVDVVVPGARVGAVSPLENAFWLARGDVREVTFEDATRDALADRIVAATFHERSAHEAHLALAGAREGRAERLEDRLSRHRRIVLEALRDARCRLVTIPRDCTPPALAEALDRAIGGKA